MCVCATDLVVLIFVKVSAKPKDECHDYGHGKYETLATIIIGLALFAVSVGIFVNSVELIVRLCWRMRIRWCLGMG